MTSNLASLSAQNHLGKVHLFCGTSVSLEDAENQSRGRWTVHSPIKRWDIPHILKQENEAGLICIVDGMFFSNESVSLMEIRTAIQAGWKVIGCSSMGALRALEAEPLGMLGYGMVYRWLRLFQVEDDDEVAQAIAPDTWMPVSLAMVDIRHLIGTLVQSGEVPSSISNEVVKEVKSLFFPKRTVNALTRILNVKLKTEHIEEEHILSISRPKQLDARGMLNLLSNWSNSAKLI